MYYLGSRYYDPVVKRFINVDKMMSTTDGTLDGKNLFVYCFNNPVMFTDENGNWPKFIEQIYEASRDIVIKYIVDPVATFINNVKEDIQNYKGNNNEKTVLESNYFSSYKGKLVIRMPSYIGSFSFGMIFLRSKETNTDVVNHEFGHTVQFDNMGVYSYTKDVFLPSVTTYWLKEAGKIPYHYYYGTPWEAEADTLGGVRRSKNNTPWPSQYPTTFCGLIQMFWK